MASLRTQIYLTADQRQRIDERRATTGMSLAETVREALDRYLAEPLDDRGAILERTFGAVPDAAMPSRDEWDR